MRGDREVLIKVAWRGVFGGGGGINGRKSMYSPILTRVIEGQALTQIF